MTPKEIAEEIGNCVECASEDCKEERKQLQEVAEMALSAITNNNQQLKEINLISSLIELGLRTLARVARFLPGAGRAISIPMELAARSSRDVITRVEARIAANDAQFAIINRIAANNAQFLLRNVR